MLPFRVFVKLQRQSAASLRPASSVRHLCSLSVSALDCSFSYVFSNFQLSTFNFQPPLLPKSFPFTLFTDPHPITSFESYRYKNVGGRGIKPLRRSDLSPLECAVADKHRVLSVFSRNRQASSPLEATLMSTLVSVDSKWFTVKLSPLESALTKKRRGWGPWTGLRSAPCLGASVAIPHLPRVTEHGSRDTSHNSRITSHPIGPIAAKRSWCNNWQRHEISLLSGETTPLPPVSKTRRADIGDSLILVPFASRAWVHRSKVGPQQGGPSNSSVRDGKLNRVGKAGSVRLG
jgi:hypothetical protein